MATAAVPLPQGLLFIGGNRFWWQITASVPRHEDEPPPPRPASCLLFREKEGEWGWERGPEMQVDRQGAAVVACELGIFAFGGLETDLSDEGTLFFASLGSWFIGNLFLELIHHPKYAGLEADPGRPQLCSPHNMSLSVLRHRHDKREYVTLRPYWYRH